MAVWKIISTSAKSSSRREKTSESGEVNDLHNAYNRLVTIRRSSSCAIFFPLHNPTDRHTHTHACIDRHATQVVININARPNSSLKFRRRRDDKIFTVAPGRGRRVERVRAERRGARPPSVIKAARHCDRWRQIARAREIPDAKDPAPPPRRKEGKEKTGGEKKGEKGETERAFRREIRGAAFASPRRGARTNDDFSMPRARGDLLAGIRRRARAGGQVGGGRREGGEREGERARERPSGRLANRGSTNRVAVYRRRSVAAWYSLGKLPGVRGVAFVCCAYVCLVRPESRCVRRCDLDRLPRIREPEYTAAGRLGRHRGRTARVEWRLRSLGGAVACVRVCVCVVCVNGRTRARAPLVCRVRGHSTAPAIRDTASERVGKRAECTAYYTTRARGERECDRERASERDPGESAFVR